MALKLYCDGCPTECTPEAVTRAGVLGEVYYCPSCAETWGQVAAEIDALRVRLAGEFEARRAAVLARARETLKTLPDE